MRVIIIASNLIVWALVGVLLLTAPPEIPLYSARAWGEARIATRWEVLLIPLILNVGHAGAWWFIHRCFGSEAVFTRIARWFMIAQSIIATGILIRLVVALSG